MGHKYDYTNEYQLGIHNIQWYYILGIGRSIQKSEETNLKVILRNKLHIQSNLQCELKNEFLYFVCFK